MAVGRLKVGKRLKLGNLAFFCANLTILRKIPLSLAFIEDPTAGGYLGVEATSTLATLSDPVSLFFFF